MTVASAPLSITLVAIWNAMPLFLSVVERAAAVRPGDGVAGGADRGGLERVTETAPPAVTVVLVIQAKAPPRTSLRDARPEAAVASAELMFVGRAP